MLDILLVAACVFFNWCLIDTRVTKYRHGTIFVRLKTKVSRGGALAGVGAVDADVNHCTGLGYLSSETAPLHLFSQPLNHQKQGSIVAEGWMCSLMQTCKCLLNMSCIHTHPRGLRHWWQLHLKWASEWVREALGQSSYGNWPQSASVSFKNTWLNAIGWSRRGPTEDSLPTSNIILIKSGLGC